MATRVSDICQNKHRGNPQSEAANLRIANKKLPLRLLIYEHLREHGPMTSAEIVSRLGLKLQTVSARMAELLAEGWLEETGTVREGYAVRRAKSSNGQQKSLF